MQAFVLTKKCAMKIERDKQRKIKKRQVLHTGLLEKSECPLKEGKEDRFVARDTESLFIKCTINII